MRPGTAALTQDVNSILAWEKANQVDEFVDLAQQKQAGLKKVVKFLYSPAINASMTYSKQLSKAESTHMDWYAGLHFKTQPDLVGVLADMTVKYTGSFDKSDTQSTGDAYSLVFRGIADPSYNTVEFGTYFIEVDVSQLKNWIVRNKDNPKINPFKGRPALIPEWNWKYQQNFTLVITKYEGQRFNNSVAVSRLFALEGFEYKPGDTTMVSLVAAYNANSLPMTLGLRQKAAPDEIPANLHLPLGMVFLQAKNSYPGVGVKFTLFIEGDVPINGFWVKKAGSDKWVNIAREVVWQAKLKRTRLTFFAEDGVWHDRDRTVNGNITLLAAPGYKMSHR